MKVPGLLAGLLLLTQITLHGSPPLAVFLRSEEVFQGGIAKLEVMGEGLAWAKASLRDREIPFFLEADGAYSALVGLDLDEGPGPLEVAVRAGGKGGEERRSTLTLHVKKREFPEERLSVPGHFDRLDEATQRRIEREGQKLARLWARSSPERLWQGAFVAPVLGGVTSPFGLRRIVNGLPRSPHGGVDLKAALGTEVAAANHGEVVLQEDLFFSGKSIVLDHGGGLYTMYFHLSDFRVGRGSRVRKGDVIARVGMTGRVTGPHLHWGVRLNGARVDPLALLERVTDRQ